MDKPTVQDIFLRFYPGYLEKYSPSPVQSKVAHCIINCKTGAYGAKGHSLSVSDMVVLHQNGQDAAHYVDSFGYKEVPEFLQEQTQQPEKINPLKHVEDTIEQNDNSFDGIINNTPTVDELEAKVKAGEQISLVDLAEAIKADKERGKEKPSIRAQLKADKERAGKKKNAKQKSQDLERS